MPRLSRILSPAGFCACAFLVAIAAFFLSPKVPETPEFVSIEVVPSRLVLTAKDRAHGLLVTALRHDGSSVDVTSRAVFQSGNSNVVSLSGQNQLAALGDGVTIVRVRVGQATAQVSVIATNLAEDVQPSFRQDILPLLTRTGCNGGGCHGKLAGQNGFKLSLRAFAPEWDHDWLTSEVRSRRLDYAFPEESLIVRKPLNRTPHEGGVKFEENSRYHRTLVDWIAARAPGPQTNELDAVRLEVLPGDRVLRSGDQQRLLVRAHYPDGRVRDVTWLAQFFSNDESTVKVTEQGTASAIREGETSVRVHFQSLVEVVRFTMPFSNAVPETLFASKHNAVDEHVFAKLKALRIPPSADGGDLAFLRRASLDATGTLPGPERVKAYLEDQRPGRRERLVEDLLSSAEFTDYWTLQLADLLQNRKERDHDVRGAKGVRGFHGWLRQQVKANRGWHEITRDMLLAKGDTQTSPQIGYYITTIGEKEKVEESELPDSVAQSFLGTRIGCARCHNHPLERYTQDDFYHFSAFFAKVGLKRVNPEEGKTELRLASKQTRDQEKHIENVEKQLRESEKKLSDEKDEAKRKDLVKQVERKTKEVTDARTELEKRSAKSAAVEQPRTRKQMIPRTLDRTSFDHVPGTDPREKFVEWMTSPENESFSGAMVNRIWKHYFHVGLIEPVDDLRASNPPSNPELWRFLKKDFASNGFDLRHLMRLILNSRTYQLSADTLPGNATDQKFYSHYFVRRLPAEVMLDAIAHATRVPDAFDGYPTGMRAIQLPDPAVGSYFLGLFGRSERVTACACERRGEVTLPQLLNLQNGTELTEKLRHPDGRLNALLKRTDAEAADELFLATVNRWPTPEERAALTSFSQKPEERSEAFQDLFWALLNSKEFVFNH